MPVLDWKPFSTPNGFEGKKITSYSCDFLEMILSNGCKYLNLCGTTLNGTLKLKKPSQLRYLDLSGRRISVENKEKILSSCRSLEKLSLSYSDLNRNDINSICHQNGQSLKVLDLQGSKGLSPEFIQDIVKFCTELREFNFDVSYRNTESFNFVVNNITAKIEKVKIGYLFLENQHIKTLVTRCNKISTLSLGSEKFTNDMLTSIIENLNNTLEELFINRVRLTSEFLFQDNCFKLVKLTKLKYLHHGYYWLPAHVEAYKLHMPNLNFYDCNCIRIARNRPLEHGIWEIKEKQFLKTTWPTDCKSCGKYL